MKKTFIFTTILAALVLTSCENFLKAKDVQSQIKESIAYANADQYTIIVDTEKGRGIVTKPAGGEAKVKPSDTFNLAFYTESDHQFVRWEIYDLTTNKKLEGNDYLTIENPNLPDTTCTLVKTPENSNIKLGVRAISAQRPQIYHNMPIYTVDGAPRNTFITVKFDHDMETHDTIYFSKKEQEELKKELNLADNDFLTTDLDFYGEGITCYGYIKDGKKYYKNISIVSDDSLGYNNDPLNYFDIPYFSNKRTLIIETALEPPESRKVGDLNVTISKDFYYLYDDITPVTMRESKTWLYSIKDWENERPQFYGYEKALRSGSNEPIPVPLVVNKDRKQLWYTFPKGGSDPAGDDPRIIPGFGHLNDTIPVSGGGDIIKIGLNITVKDNGGSNLKPDLTCIIKNTKDELNNPLYTWIGEFTIHYTNLVTTYSLSSDGYINGGEDDEYYWIEISKEDYPELRNQEYLCLTFQARDYDNNIGDLSSSSGEILHFWLKLDN